MLTFYIRASALGVDFCRASDAHITARFAPVAPHGEIQTLGEHGSLCRRFGQHARHWAPFRGSASLVNWRLTARI